MRSPDEGGIDWDFTPVSDLILSLSEAANVKLGGTSSTSPSPDRITTPTFQLDQLPSHSDLGNFDKIWAFLGQPLDTPPPNVPLPLTGQAGEDVDEGTRLHLTISKGVRWRDDAEGGELADVEEAENKLSLPGLSRQDRKKLRRKETKAARESKKQVGIPPTSSSEDDHERPRTPKRSPDTRAVIQQILYGSPKTLVTGSLAPKGLIPRASLPIDPGTWPVANPHTATPSSKSRPAPADHAALVAAAAKKDRLMTKLKAQFIDDRPFLNSLSMRTFTSFDNTGTKEGIHVFVDASNIMIGFHDSLKLSRGLPLQARIRRQPLSFDRLALILERGRPASKRVLVGSDNLDAIEEARRIGYEANILDRVLKARELTPRQKKFSSRNPRNNDSSNNNNNNGNTSASAANGTSGGSGSETTAAAVFAEEKWVEQAVDEILHLKILESVVDAAEPSTMVLATGDAAEAEYSQGFLRMAERALEKGWTVELVSFRRNTSGMYRRKEFRAKWKGRFSIVELDDFVEELLGSS
ncbi:MAG: hypothetical protein LQ348_002121 [Seirophora lacunosa]|nr:MAG: hypothetical protein LQ348_002121 [Seirophora lacunosa]